MSKRGKLPDPTRHLKFKNFSDMLAEASRLVTFRDAVFQRHSEELQTYFDSEDNYDLSLRDAVIELLMTDEEGDDFDYDFHMYRKSVLEIISRNEIVEIQDIFIKSCQHKKLVPLGSAIVSSTYSKFMLYDEVHSALSTPKLDATMFHFFDIDCSVLKLYIAFAEMYGESELLQLMGYDI